MEARHPRTVEDLRDFQKLAYGLIFGVLALGTATVVFSQRVQDLFEFGSGASRGALNAARLLLLVGWMVLVGQWMGATANEFRLWQEHLSAVFVRSDAYLAMVVLAFGLGLMPILILYDARWFAGYYLAFLLVNLWTQRLTNQHFGRALERSRGERPKARRARVLDALESYWLSKPQLGRIGAMAAIAAALFAAALYTGTQGGPRRDAWDAALLGLLFLLIGAGEAVIRHWRRQRDDRLETLLDGSPGSP